MDGNDGLTTTGTANDHVRAALAKSDASTMLDRPQRLSARHSSSVLDEVAPAECTHTLDGVTSRSHPAQEALHGDLQRHPAGIVPGLAVAAGVVCHRPGHPLGVVAHRHRTLQ